MDDPSEEKSESGKGLPLMTVAAMVAAAAVGATVGLAVGIVAEVHLHDRWTGMMTLAVVVAGGVAALCLLVRELQAEHRRSECERQREREHHQEVIETMSKNAEVDERRHEVEVQRLRQERDEQAVEVRQVRQELAETRAELIATKAKTQVLLSAVETTAKKMEAAERRHEVEMDKIFQVAYKIGRLDRKRLNGRKPGPLQPVARLPRRPRTRKSKA